MNFIKNMDTQSKGDKTMDLFEEMNENVNAKKQKNNKTAKIIIVAIVILSVIILAIIGIIMYLKSLNMKFYVDGIQTTINDDYFQVTEDGKIYISIQDISQLLEATYYKGEYGKISEDNSKGYVTFDEETVTFEANSNKIYKISSTTNSNSKRDSEENYAYIYLDEEIKYTKGKLYTTPDGINKILNVSFNYENNSVSIYTLQYLNEYYTEKIADYGYKKINEKYTNQKAMKNDILIVEREDGKKAIIKPNGDEIIGAKYTDITYMENTGDFVVSLNGKYGIINAQGKPKINLDYDAIYVLDEDLGLYVVKQNNKYGVLNQNGNVVIYIENDDIGIDRSLYTNTTIKNPYLLYDNCIAVKKADKWGIYNKNGKIILPIEYDSLGCVVGTSSTRSAGNVLTIDDYEAIVVCKDKKYGIINSTGTELIPCALDTIYSITSSGVTTYKIEGVQNGAPYSYDLEKYFDAMNIKKVNRNTASKDTETIEDISNNTTNTTKNNTNSNNTDEEDSQTSQDSTNSVEENDEDVLVVEE